MKKIIQALVILVLLLLSAVLIKIWLKTDAAYVNIKTLDKPALFLDTINRKVEYKRIGADGMNYYFSMSDTFPTLPPNIRQFFCSDDYTPTFKGFKRGNFPFANPEYNGAENIPHISLFQGDPLHLHGVVTLENLSVTGDDSIMAVMGIVDVCGNTNNVFKATPSNVEITTVLYNDSLGGANYYFTKEGIAFYKNRNPSYTLSNNSGKKGQVLMMNSNGDIVDWQYVIQNIEKTGLPTFSSSALAKKAHLISGDAFILETIISGAPIKILAFVQ